MEWFIKMTDNSNYLSLQMLPKRHQDGALCVKSYVKSVGRPNNSLHPTAYQSDYQRSSACNNACD
jgi:hypothetical protein